MVKYSSHPPKTEIPKKLNDVIALTIEKLMLNTFWIRKYIFPTRKGQLGLPKYPGPNRGGPYNLLWPIKEIFSFKVRGGIIRYDERSPTETVAN